MLDNESLRAAIAARLRAAREQAVHAQNAAGPTAMQLEEVGQGLSIQTWNAHMSLKPADGQHGQSKQNPGFQFRNFEAIAEGIGYCGEHGLFKLLLGSRRGRFCRDHFALSALGFDLRLQLLVDRL